MSTGPDLMFLASTDSVGFTAASVTGFREISPAAIVRELIQNSLDAVEPPTKAVVRFRLGRIQTSKIPGIESYRSAFDKAVKRRRKETGDNLPDQEQLIVDRIQGALDEDTQDLLTVIDNGIGLDQKSMEAILSDGISHKSAGASGAFGNGHLSVFPTSDLRYVLYGGVNEGKWIASGHAILASHDKDKSDETGRSAHGYYLSRHKGRRHEYPGQSATPPVIAGVLKEIADTSKHGTAVMVPAFNNFRDNRSDVHEAIREAAACSFFSAIHDERLEVVIEDGREGNGEALVHVIGRGNLHATLAEFEGRKRNRDFLSGFKANLAYAAIERGTKHQVPVLDGHVYLYLLKPAPSGTTRTNLCRNGMWITNSDAPSGGMPGFYNAFGDRETFEAVVLVSGEEAPEFHNLVRKAEGPLHNRLDAKVLVGADQTVLRYAFGEIKEWLRENVAEVDNEEFSPSDFLSFADTSDGSGGSRTPGYHFQGILTAIRRRPSSPRRNVDAPGGVRMVERGKGKGTGKRKEAAQEGTRKRPSLPAHFTVVATPQGSGKRRIVVSCLEDSPNLELRLFANENTDPTTDRIWKDRVAAIKAATIDGKRVPKENIISGEDPGIRLGDLKAGTTTEIVVEYALDSEGRSKTEEGPITSLRVEIGRAPEEVQGP